MFYHLYSCGFSIRTEFQKVRCMRINSMLSPHTATDIHHNSRTCVVRPTRISSAFVRTSSFVRTTHSHTHIHFFTNILLHQPATNSINRIELYYTRAYTFMLFTTGLLVSVYNVSLNRYFWIQTHFFRLRVWHRRSTSSSSTIFMRCFRWFFRHSIYADTENTLDTVHTHYTRTYAHNIPQLWAALADGSPTEML